MVTVRLDSTVPLEEQIYQELRHAIARGDVHEGEELPSVRQLGDDLGVHFNTVARAYRRLRDEGLLLVGRGRPVVVRERPARRKPVAEVRESVRQKIEGALTEARLGGLTAADVRRLFQSVVGTFEREES